MNRSRSETVGFVGHYGMRNFGDDLFCLAAIYGAEVVAGKHAVICAPDFGGQNGSSFVLSKSANFLYERGGGVALCVKMYALLLTVLRARVIVYGGGSVITGRKSLRNSVLQWLAAKKIIELGAIGVSVGPFSNVGDSERAKCLLESMRFVALRDRASRDIINALGVKGPEVFSGADLAPLAVENYKRGTKPAASSKPLTKKSTKTIAIIPCNLHATGADEPDCMTEKINEELINTALKIAELSEVTFVVMSVNSHPSDGDEQLSFKIVRSLTEGGIPASLISYSSLGASDILDAIEHCDAVLSVRLHGAVSAFLLGVPFVLVEYHKKCTDFLNQIGLADHFRAPLKVIEDGKLGAAFANLLDSPPDLSAKRRELIIESGRMFSEWPWR